MKLVNGYNSLDSFENTRYARALVGYLSVRAEWLRNDFTDDQSRVFFCPLERWREM